MAFKESLDKIIKHKTIIALKVFQKHIFNFHIYNLKDPWKKY